MFYAISRVVNIYNADVVNRHRSIGPRSQSYDLELQIQRCKNLQHYVYTSAF
jgi:hypothetical protein